ncbi:MAG TPA: type II secretion system F family protein [Pirellulaceae bacterium]|nr:type II secretion system F family protein [Pirellulaceae bacterium]
MITIVDEQYSSDVPVLSAAAAEAVLDRAAQITAAGMPLAAGLRASAAECDSWRLSRGLKSIANEVERGRSLEDCLAISIRRLPPHLVGLIQAAQRSGAIAPMLVEWLQNRRAARAHWRAIVAALAYPVFSLLMAIGVYILFAVEVVPPFKQMFEEFGLRLPAMTVQFLRSCEVAPPLLAFLGVGIVATAVTTRVFGGRAGWSWLISSLPLIGNAWHWTGVAEMLRCLGLLVEQRVPLPEALRLTAGGISDAYVGGQCQALARQVEQGTSLTMSLVKLRTLPLSIVPLVHWGENHDALGLGLRSAAEMLEGRLNLRANLLGQVLPPILFITVTMAIASGAISLFLPLISLIQGLS